MCLSLLEGRILILHWPEGLGSSLGRREVLTGLSICPRGACPTGPGTFTLKKQHDFPLCLPGSNAFPHTASSQGLVLIRDQHDIGKLLTATEAQKGGNLPRATQIDTGYLAPAGLIPLL